MHRSAIVPSGAISALRAGQACASRAQSTRITSTTTTLQRQYHDATKTQSDSKPEHSGKGAREDGPRQEKVKTVSQSDDELRARLEAMSGDGGAAGVEYENGTAEGLKKNVKRNMFRVI